MMEYFYIFIKFKQILYKLLGWNGTKEVDSIRAATQFNSEMIL